MTLTVAELNGFKAVVGAPFQNDTITLSAAGSVNLTATTISGIEQIFGSLGTDTINWTGNAAGLVVDGRDGDDALSGGAGSTPCSAASVPTPSTAATATTS